MPWASQRARYTLPMLPSTLITTLSSERSHRGCRGALQELRGQLGLAVVAVDTRTLLQRRWGWLETQNVPDDVMAFLDLIFERTPKPPLSAHDWRPWTIHRDRPEMARLLVWLAQTMTKGGIPDGEATWSYRMHDIVTEGFYGDVEDSVGGDMPPGEIYEAAWDQAHEETIEQPWQMVGILAPYQQSPTWHNLQYVKLLNDRSVFDDVTRIEWRVEGGPALTLRRSMPDGSLTVSVTVHDPNPVISDLQETVFELDVSGPRLWVLEGLEMEIAKVAPLLEETGRLSDELLWFDSLERHMKDLGEIPKEMLFLRETLRWAATLWIDRVLNVLNPMRNVITSAVRDYLVATPDALQRASRHPDPIECLISRAVSAHQEAFIEENDEERAEELEEQEEGEDFTVLRSFSDGASIVEILTTLGLKHNGQDMRHCVGTEKWGHPEALRSGRVRVFSYLRPDGEPQATWEAANERGLPTTDLQGPRNGPIPEDEARVRLAWFIYDTRSESLASTTKERPTSAELLSDVFALVPEARNGGRLEPKSLGIFGHGWPLYHSALVQPSAPGRPKMDVTLECRCADDRGRYHAPSGDEKDDQVCIEDYEETLAQYDALEQASVPANVRVMDTSDRDSRHSDCYLDFTLSDIESVVRVLDEIELEGDVLDVYGDPNEMHPAMRAWIEKGLYWQIEEHDPR